MTDKLKPVAAYTVDHTGCWHISGDVALLEKIAKEGSLGETEVIYLYPATLRAIVAEALVALEPFAEEAACYDPDTGDGGDILWATPAYFKIGHLRAARAVSAKIKEKTGE